MAYTPLPDPMLALPDDFHVQAEGFALSMQAQYKSLRTIETYLAAVRWLGEFVVDNEFPTDARQAHSTAQLTHTVVRRFRRQRATCNNASTTSA